MTMCNNSFHRRGVVGIVYRKRNEEVEYLVMHRIHPWMGWEFVKGGRGRRSEEDAIKMELQQETGLANYNLKKVPGGMLVYDFKRQKDRISGQAMQVFLIEAQKDCTIIPDFKEHNDYYWGNFEETKNLLTHREARKLLENMKRLIV